MLNAILAQDAALFRFLNSQATSPWWDDVMKFFSGMWPWVLALMAALVVMLWHRRWDWWRHSVMIFAVIGLTDAISSFVLKPFFGRIRPCRQLADAEVLLGCAGLYGFPSNHAANAAAVAVSFLLLLGWRLGTVAFLGLALVVAYSRVYVGAHYPLDVTVGFALGATIASCGYAVAKRWLKFSSHSEKTFSS